MALQTSVKCSAGRHGVMRDVTLLHAAVLVIATNSEEDAAVGLQLKKIKFVLIVHLKIQSNHYDIFFKRKTSHQIT